MQIRKDFSEFPAAVRLNLRSNDVADQATDEGGQDSPAG